jgi:hypothetical protein
VLLAAPAPSVVVEVCATAGVLPPGAAVDAKLTEEIEVALHPILCLKCIHHSVGDDKVCPTSSCRERL